MNPGIMHAIATKIELAEVLGDIAELSAIPNPIQNLAVIFILSPCLFQEVPALVPVNILL